MEVVFQFDVRTVAFFIAMTFLAQAIAIGAQAYLIRDLRQYHGVRAALAAHLCMAAGILLRLFVNQLPMFFNTVLANTLILVGPTLFYVALGQFTGLGYSKALASAIPVVVLSCLWYFTYVQNNIGLRIVVVSVGTVIVVFLLVHQLWRIRQTSLQFSANLMLIPFLIYGVFQLIRSTSLALNPPQDALNNTPVQSATYLLSLALSFFWSTGFLLMVSQRLRNDLMEMASIDFLTRIPNRRATQLFLERELSRAQRHESEFSVLLIDIDDFKQVNDRWGHSVGDHVLVKTAAVFQSVLRRQDWVGRWGGEEFLAILPGGPYCEPEALAERLRETVANSSYTHSAASFHITVSIGVACADGTSTIDEILREADTALYKAKRTKNAISMAGRSS